MGRRRRTAEETRELILEAAQSQLREVGPASIKLDQVAEAVGISRQAVLHHYGSRTGLMRAVVERAWKGLFADLAVLGARGAQGRQDFLDLVDEVIRKKGNARLGAWLLLSEEGLPQDVFEGALADLPGAVVQTASDREARYGLLLIGAALFGDAIFGMRLRQALSLPDTEEDRADFRRWLADRLQALETPRER